VIGSYYYLFKILTHSTPDTDCGYNSCVGISWIGLQP
jgi:hypothetical protein